MKKIFITMLLLGIAVAGHAQNFPFGTVDQEALNMTKYAGDKMAHAVVLNEYGESRFFAGEMGHASITHDYHVRIKIFDKEGLKYGKIEIPLYNADILGMEETADQIQAVTIYKDENGVVKTIEIDPYNIATIKKNKNHKVIKFNLEGMKPGSIIEYAYHFVTPFFQNFYPWQFQAEIPKKTSTYVTYVPAFWKYNAVLRGNQKITRTTADIVRQCFVIGSAKSDCVHTLYEMTNIPALDKEDYITSPKNLMSGLFFTLSQYTDPYTGKPSAIATDWESVDYQMLNSENINGQFKKLDFLNTKLAPVTADITGQLPRAKAVYQYLQKNMKWDSTYATGSSSIRKAFDKHIGDAGDINLLLVAALNWAGVSSSAVVLSTRDHGAINKQYPIATAFDYVIAQAEIDNKTYLLDATDPSLPFGILPLHCLSDSGRVLDQNKWVSLTANQSKNNTYLANLTLQENGKLTGTLTTRSTGYAAYQKRQAIKAFATTNDYIANLDERLTGLKISRSEIENLDSLDLPITESFAIEVEAGSADKISFNPYVINRILENPFKAEDRNYPVDLGMPSDTKIIVNISYPENYIIENTPQGTALTLPDQGGRFSVTSQFTGNSLSLTNTLSLKRAIYTVDEYQQLKELYDKIIELEKTDIVFKKKLLN